MSSVDDPAAATMADAAFLRRVNELRAVDHVSNWFYLAREYAFLAVVIGLTAWLYNSILSGDVSWGWAIPATLLANLCVGAGQHRLATLTHEAAHYMLFKNRLVNEFVSEWFCMFPIFGTTHSYRVQHFSHHQFPNDPDKDPDWTTLTKSGHKFAFPMSRGRFLWHCLVKQVLWPPALLRYILVRALYKVDRDDGTPYRMVRRASPWMFAIGIVYHAALIAGLTWCVRDAADAGMMWAIAGTWLAIGLAVYSRLSRRWFAEYVVKPDLAVRTTARMRLVFNTLVATTIAWLTLATDRPVWLWFLILWVLPIGTSFALFMVLRQIVQHGNADRERYSNTRVFLVHPLLSLSIFPIGNDYHLPHHLFPMIPHYSLKALHELLLELPEYREGATVVRGYLASPEHPKAHPTVLDIMTR